MDNKNSFLQKGFNKFAIGILFTILGMLLVFIVPMNIKPTPPPPQPKTTQINVMKNDIRLQKFRYQNSLYFTSVLKFNNFILMCDDTSMFYMNNENEKIIIFSCNKNYKITQINANDKLIILSTQSQLVKNQDFFYFFNIENNKITNFDTIGTKEITNENEQQIIDTKIIGYKENNSLVFATIIFDMEKQKFNYFIIKISLQSLGMSINNLIMPNDFNGFGNIYIQNNFIFLDYLLDDTKNQYNKLASYEYDYDKLSGGDIKYNNDIVYNTTPIDGIHRTYSFLDFENYKTSNNYAYAFNDKDIFVDIELSTGKITETSFNYIQGQYWDGISMAETNNFYNGIIYNFSPNNNNLSIYDLKNNIIKNVVIPFKGKVFLMNNENTINIYCASDDNLYNISFSGQIKYEINITNINDIFSFYENVWSDGMILNTIGRIWTDPKNSTGIKITNKNVIFWNEYKDEIKINNYNINNKKITTKIINFNWKKDNVSYISLIKNKIIIISDKKIYLINDKNEIEKYYQVISDKDTDYLRIASDYGIEINNNDNLYLSTNSAGIQVDKATVITTTLKIT